MFESSFDRAKFNALAMYQNLLRDKFINCPMTPAMLIRMNSTLAEIQFIKQRQETHPVWKLPVEVIASDENPFAVVVKFKEGV